MSIKDKTFRQWKVDYDFISEQKQNCDRDSYSLFHAMRMWHSMNDIDNLAQIQDEFWDEYFNDLEHKLNEYFDLMPKKHQILAIKYKLSHGDTA